MIPLWVGPYVGLRFADRGRSADGVDCWGLVMLVYAEVFGITLTSYEERYVRANDRIEVARVFFEEVTTRHWQRVPLHEARPPDVISLRVAGNAHVGVIVEPDRFLHVLPGREACVERLRPHWTPRVEGVYRHEALARV